MLNRSRLSWKDPSVTSSNQNNTRSLHVRSMKTKVARGTPWEKSSRPRKNQTSTDNDERQSWTENERHGEFRLPSEAGTCSALSSPHSVSRTCWWVLRKQHETRRNFTAGRKSEEPFLSTRDSTATLCSARSLSLIVVHRQLLGGCCGLEIYGKSRCWVE